MLRGLLEVRAGTVIHLLARVLDVIGADDGVDAHCVAVLVGGGRLDTHLRLVA